MFTINVARSVNGQEIKGQLTIVDLAGSEKLSDAGADEKTREESVEINKSLSTLSAVFLAMQQRKKSVPYRESTLTKALQEYFRGGNKVVLIACVNEAAHCYSESVNTLNFAQRARGVSIAS